MNGPDKIAGIPEPLNLRVRRVLSSLSIPGVLSNNGQLLAKISRFRHGRTEIGV